METVGYDRDCPPLAPTAPGYYLEQPSLLTEELSPGGSATANMTIQLDGKPVDVAVTLRTADVVPPPPPMPLLTRFVGPATARAGQTITLEVGLSLPSSVPVTVMLSAFGPLPVSVPAGSSVAQAQVRVPLNQPAGNVTLTATYQGVAKQLLLSVVQDTPTPGPTPTPGDEVNVTQYGVKGDGVTDNRAALQRLADTLTNKTLYFPAGKYFVSNAILFLKGGMRILGDGDQSVLYHAGRRFLDFGMQATESAKPGYAVEKVQFLGLPGLYQKTGNRDPSIQLVAALNAVVKDCLFTGSGYPILNLGSTYGTQILNCRVAGWGEVAVFCNGGETIRDCRFIQDDPNPTAENSSHGLYFHSGAKDVLVENVTIENGRKFSAQIYGESDNTTIERITIRGCTFRSNQEGITVQQGGAGKARAKDIVIENCLFDGIYRYPALWLKHGDRITVRGCTFRGAKHTAIAIGRYNGWDSPDWATLVDCLIEENRIEGCTNSIYVENIASRGKFIFVRLIGNTIVNSPAPARNGDTTGVVIS